MREYVGPTQQVRQVVFVPGEPMRLAAATNEAAHVWRPDRTDPVVLSWDAPGWTEPRLSASPDGRWLVAGPIDRLNCWDLTTDPPGGLTALSLSGLLAARFTGTRDRLTVVYKWADADRFELRAADLPVSGRKAGVPGPPAGLLVPWGIAEQVGAVKPAEWRHFIALSDDGSRLALSAREKAVHVWDVGTKQPSRTIALRGFPCGLAFSPDASRLVVDGGTTIYLFDARTLEPVQSWKAKYSYTPGLAWSPDGRLLARTDTSTTVRVYEVETGRQVMAVGSKRGRLGCVAFSPDGLTLATGTHEGPVRVWDVE